MKLKLISIAAIAFAIFFQHACSKDTDSDTSSGAVNIQIENNSIFDFELIHVNTSGGKHDYGNLLSGQSSDYKSFEKAFRYAQIEMKINGEITRLQPIDYVGEAPLPPGNHAYVLDVSRSAGQYNLKLSLK